MRTSQQGHNECLMTLERWLQNVREGGFTDYDGYGELATLEDVSDIKISPSQAKSLPKLNPDGKYTHIQWYNR